MRKAERSTSENQAWEIFDQSDYALLSVIDEENHPYGVPLSCVREGHTLYFHCALEGKKLDALSKHPRVSITAVSNVEISPAHLTTFYESCMMSGIAQIVEDDEEKIKALKLIGKRFAANEETRMNASIQHSLYRTGIVRIDIDTISGKRNLKAK